MAIQKSVGNYSKLIGIRLDPVTRIPTAVIGLYIDAASYANGDPYLGIKVISLDSNLVPQTQINTFVNFIETALLARPEFSGGTQVA